MVDEVATAEADVAAAQAALVAAEAEAAHPTLVPVTVAPEPVTATTAVFEQIDRPAGTAHVITEAVQTAYLNDRGPVE